jgi:hypothetical protein
MPATVHAGSIQRWFEKLCRIKHEPLATLVKDKKFLFRRLPEASGVYCFWWVGSVDLLAGESCSRDLTLVGPGGSSVHIAFDAEWLGLAAGGPVPLYVGKTTGIRERVKQQLLIARMRSLPTGISAAKAPRPTTSCQVRAGIDQLFRTHDDTRELVLRNVGLSYVELPGDGHAANRFYLEDLAIGMMRPPLNIDVER